MNVFHEVFGIPTCGIHGFIQIVHINFGISNEGLPIFGISNHIHNEIKDLHLKPILQLLLKYFFPSLYI